MACLSTLLIFPFFCKKAKKWNDEDGYVPLRFPALFHPFNTLCRNFISIRWYLLDGIMASSISTNRFYKYCVPNWRRHNEMSNKVCSPWDCSKEVLIFMAGIFVLLFYKRCCFVLKGLLAALDCFSIRCVPAARRIVRWNNDKKYFSQE